MLNKKTISIKERVIVIKAGDVPAFAAQVGVHALFQIATALCEQNRFTEGAKIYELILRIKPSPVVHFNLGCAYRMLKRYEDAIKAFQSAINMKPDYFEAYNDLGSVLLIQKRFNEAELAYRKSVTINPEYNKGWANLASVYAIMQRFDDALEPARTAISLKPDDAISYNTLGASLYALGRYNEAKEALEKAIELNPEYNEARSNLALVYYRLGRYEEAMNIFMRLGMTDKARRCLAAMRKGST